MGLDKMNCNDIKYRLQVGATSEKKKNTTTAKQIEQGREKKLK